MSQIATNPSGERSPAAAVVLLSGVFVAATCALVYELLAGTVSSYLLGNTVTQFSLVIGFFLTAMGLGSYLSKYVRDHLLAWFVALELAIGVVGGTIALIGFVTFAYSAYYTPVLLALILVIGTMIGMEVPLLIRILQETQTLRVSIANVLTADYAGALGASLLFPFVLIPLSTFVGAGLLCGLANVAVAIVVLWYFRPHLGRALKPLGVAGGLSAVGLVTLLALSDGLVSRVEDRLYAHPVIYAQSSPYQRVVLTHKDRDLRLFLDGHLQFSSVDEHHYHEALVHPAMSLAASRRQVLILGGGDGMAAREVLRYADVERITLVDIDEHVVDLCATNDRIIALNQGSLTDPRVEVVYQDALLFLRETPDTYDVVIIDLPDPSRPEIAKLYSSVFYGLVGNRLNADGMMVTQATNPFRTREAFWCIHETVGTPTFGDGGRLHPVAYHTHVPTFGMWGFVVAGHAPPAVERFTLTVETRYLTEPLFAALQVFPRDLQRIETTVSTLTDPVVVTHYRRGAGRTS